MFSTSIIMESKYIYTPYTKQKKGWDRKIPFEQLSRRLLDDFNLVVGEWYRKKTKKNISKQLVYYAILLIQLYNGTRISEAIDGFKEWLVKNQSEVEVKVRKRKDGETRIVVIPDIIKFNRNIIERAVEFAFNNNLDLIKPKNLEKWSLINFDINTHTLRKAWESYMSRKWQGDVTAITNWQGRKRVDSHLVYLRREEFKDKFKDLLDIYFK